MVSRMASVLESVKRQPEVTRWLADLSEAAERLASQASELQQRLAPVLGPEEQQAEERKSCEVGCQIAAHIQATAYSLGNVEEVIASILRRLEV